MDTFKTYSFPEARSTVVCGDIHGDFNSLVYKMCIQYHLTDTLLIVAGDCGFGFDKPGYYEQIFQSQLTKTQQIKQLDSDGSWQPR